MGSLNRVSYVGGITAFTATNATKAEIMNCYNAGKITLNAEEQKYIGGIMGQKRSGPIYTAEHNYYIADNVETDDSAKIGESKSEEDMKKQEFVNSLNDGQDKPVWEIRAGENNGFPVLINSTEE